MDFGDFVLSDRFRMRPGARTTPGAMLFDLDGTLIDSVPDITLAVGELMAASGLQPYGEAEVRDMVGHGLRPLVERALVGRLGPVGADVLDHHIGLMRQIYPRHLTGRTRLMPGARAALERLSGEGVQLALVTNKLQSAANSVLDHFGLTDFFSVIIGDQARPNGLKPKPAPDMLQFTLARLETQAADAMMVGDSAADIGAAQAAGIFSVALRNGYSTVPVESLKPDSIIDDLDALDDAIAGWRDN